MFVTRDANHVLGAFYMVGDIESARAKGEKILAELEGK
jgi:F-type H+-transporting ATPase subunit beta